MEYHAWGSVINLSQFSDKGFTPNKHIKSREIERERDFANKSHCYAFRIVFVSTSAVYRASVFIQVRGIIFGPCHKICGEKSDSFVCFSRSNKFYLFTLRVLPMLSSDICASIDSHTKTIRATFFLSLSWASSADC